MFVTLREGNARHWDGRCETICTLSLGIITLCSSYIMMLKQGAVGILQPIGVVELESGAIAQQGSSSTTTVGVEPSGT